VYYPTSILAGIGLYHLVIKLKESGSLESSISIKGIEFNSKSLFQCFVALTLLVLCANSAVVRAARKGGVFDSATPPDSIMTDLMWIADNYDTTEVILVLKEGYFPAHGYWAQYLTNANIYVGSLHDLLCGIPSKAIPIVTNVAQPIHGKLQNHKIILVVGKGWGSLYEADPFDLILLEKLHGSVHQVRNCTVDEILAWTSIINTGLPFPERRYVIDSADDWKPVHGSYTRYDGVLGLRVNEGERYMWIEKRLNINVSDYSFALLRASPSGNRIGYVDFYDPENRHIGRWTIDSSEANWTVYVFDISSCLEGQTIGRIAIVISASDYETESLIDYFLFFGI